MSGNVPCSQPYPWASEESVKTQQEVICSLRKRKFVGSGLKLLRKESIGPKSKMGKVARNILMNLFYQHGMEVPDAKKLETETRKYHGAESCNFQKRDAPKPGCTDDDILRNAQAGKYSMFISIMNIIDAAEVPVPTKVVLEKVCLTLQPGSLPGVMDAKDMVLAGLHFVSSRQNIQSKDLLSLPLIQPVQLYSDLEKRNYIKAGSWKLDDIRIKLLKMEEIFLTSSSSWKWLQREAFCPRISKDEESIFFMKGTVPPNADPKNCKTENSRKGKAISPSSSLLQADTESSIIAEASIDETNSYAEDEAVVEATIIEEIA
jgi:hypothetical protein